MGTPISQRTTPLPKPMLMSSAVAPAQVHWTEVWRCLHGRLRVELSLETRSRTDNRIASLSGLQPRMISRKLV